MKLIHASGFSKNDRDDYRVIIFSNLLNSFKIILEAMESYDLTFQNEGNEVRYLLVLSNPTLVLFDTDYRYFRHMLSWSSWSAN